ncbi:hypothetical protein [Ruegeria sp. HKCCA4008]|nr:hypothetical protein [Ruegeria sp. HKCCA4008]
MDAEYVIHDTTLSQMRPGTGIHRALAIQDKAVVAVSKKDWMKMYR